ncbi:hypothetical protein [Streptomyces sp. NPDC002328]|uniref:hypothetical protein n=1 Tax=Streptomyces sp. NPDC002328 TaxID=3364642 RepID=UPI0036CF6D5A
MKNAEAAWVFEHVIIGYHDANETNWWCGPDQSDDRLICVCQLPCTWCRSGQHDRCRRFQDRQRALVTRAGGDGECAPFRPLGYGPATHLRAPARWRPPGPKRPLYVPVWLADRVCRYLCDCAVCRPTQAIPPTSPRAWDHGVLFDLGVP